MQLYVVTSIAKSLDAVKQNLPEHRTYLRKLENGDGMLIYRANSVEEAQQLAEADPMHKNGTR
jgi:uncharacterized protein